MTWDQRYPLWAFSRPIRKRGGGRQTRGRLSFLFYNKKYIQYMYLQGEPWKICKWAKIFFLYIYVSRAGIDVLSMFVLSK